MDKIKILAIATSIHPAIKNRVLSFILVSVQIMPIISQPQPDTGVIGNPA
jgi:hypothetical protein